MKSTSLQKSLLPVILLAFFSLSCLYSLSTPFFEKTDEVYHVAYVKHVADGQGFPPPDPDNPARQEATQPPLYYLLGAALIAGIDTGDIGSLTRLNPHYRPIWDGIAGNNRNRYLHTADEITPHQGAALAVRLLRYMSIVIGCVTVAATYGLVRSLLLGRLWVAAGAAAFCAFNPRFLYVSSTVNNDVLVSATCALTGWAAMRLVRTPRPNLWQVVVLGLALGAALLSKVSAAIMIPVVLLALAHAAYAASGGQRRAALRRGLGWTATVLLCAAAISGWWFARNAILLNGDPTGAAVHVEKWGRRRRALTTEDLRLEIQGLEESYWAVFGLNSIPIDRRINLALFAVDRLTLVGGIILAIRQAGWPHKGAQTKSTPLSGAGQGSPDARAGAEGEVKAGVSQRFDRPARFGLVLLGLWAMGNLGSVFYWMYLMKGVNLGRLLYPALPALATLMVLSLAQLFPSAWRGRVTAALSGSLLALAIACPFVYILPNYAPPPILEETEVGPLTERLDADFQGQIKLLGYAIDGQETWPGDRLAIKLYYQALVPFGIDYTVFVHVVDSQGNIVVQQDTYPGMGRYPTTRWQPGEIIADTFYLTLPEWTPVPGTLTFEAGFYDHQTDLRLLVVDDQGQAVADSVWFHPMRTVPPPDSAE